MLRVWLEPYELDAAAHVGIARTISSLKRKLKADESINGLMERMGFDITGAIGEKAVAKALNLYWPASVDVNSKGIPDVGGTWEVRATTNPNGCLNIRDHDDPERPYVLVIIDPPVCSIVGFKYARDARRPEWRRKPRQHWIWSVPQDFLDPLPIVKGE